MENCLLQHGGGNVMYIAVIILGLVLTSFSIWIVFSIAARIVAVAFDASFVILYRLYCISDFGFDMLHVYLMTLLIWCLVYVVGFLVKNIIKLIFK